MFEEFTQRARQVVVLAQHEARGLRHNYIGTEHLLLGLVLEQEGVAARVLESLDVTAERVRAAVLRLVGSAEELAGGQIPFTPRAKKVLELSLRESLSLGHTWIGTEHILLGLVREGEGVGARVLRELDVDLKMVRNQVIRMLSGPRGRACALEEPDRSAPGAPFSYGLFRVMGRLSAEIRHELNREPDTGDLVLILASGHEGLAARALAELGVEPETLWGTIERIRPEHAAQEGRVGPETLGEIRRRLGLPEPPGAAA